MERTLRGYLNEPFRIFCNKGIPETEVLPHYHDFQKLVILLDGNIEYMIEEQRYRLHAGSLVFVSAGTIHRPILHKGDEYERVIVYLSDEFLASREGIGKVFDISRRKQRFMAESPELSELVSSRARLLSDASCRESLSPRTLQESRLCEFLIMAADCISGKDTGLKKPIIASPAILGAIDYIGENLTGDLRCEAIAQGIHLNKSYLMHLFRSETGYTLKEYVTDKRLFAARTLLEKGESMAAAAEKSGFTSYSSFYRAFTDKYGTNPGHKKSKAAGILEE